MSNDCIADSGVQLIEVTYFFKFSAGHILFFFGSQAQVPFFRKISVCFLFMAKVEFLHQKESFAFDCGEICILDVHE